MVLADLGADVVRVDRPGVTAADPGTRDQVLRNRRAILEIDVKQPGGVHRVLGLVDSADVLMEGFRPGTTERLGLGPDLCRERNQGLVYARMTGWGQTGPLSARAGHDINYISVTGALHAIGRPEQAPVPPMNLVGDFGGGSMLLVIGVLSALLERQLSGEGQVVDAAMVDGAGVLLTPMFSLRGLGQWSDDRGVNLVDGGAPFYDTYRCSDGRYVAVGALEPQFYAELLRGIGLDDQPLPDQLDRSGWPVLRRAFAERFATRSRDEWAEAFAGVDACVTPVLTAAEAPRHPHARARAGHLVVDGIEQPAPAPRFSRTPLQAPLPPPVPRSSDVPVSG
jgi:alpha-methylacyl-CoA racemase